MMLSKKFMNLKRVEKFQKVANANANVIVLNNNLLVLYNVFT